MFFRLDRLAINRFVIIIPRRHGTIHFPDGIPHCLIACVMKSETPNLETITNIMTVPKIERGSLHAYFIYDVADTIDLLTLQSIEGHGFRQAQLTLRSPSSPSYIQFVVPPLSADLPSLIMMGLQVQPRIKLYDYGTVSIRLSFGYSGNWSGFAALARQLKQSEELAGFSNQLLKQTLAQAKPALNKEHNPLVEDYFVLEVESFQPPLTTSELLADYKEDLASLILAETGPVTPMEAQDALSKERLVICKPIWLYCTGMPLLYLIRERVLKR